MIHKLAEMDLKKNLKQSIMADYQINDSSSRVNCENTTHFAIFNKLHLGVIILTED
jgi:hypothetical protein